MPVVNVRLSLKVTVFVAVVLVIETVAAFTVLLNVVPPEFVIVKVPMSVPIAPETVTAPIVLIVILELEPFAVPEILDKLIAFAIPVPKVKVTPSTKVVAPKVI